MSVFTASAQDKAKKENDVYVFAYDEKLNLLRHDFDPWKKTTYSLNGVFWQKDTHFCRHDTLTTSSNKKYESKLEIYDSVLLRQSYGRSELNSVIETEFFESLINTARYSPYYLLDFINRQKNMVGFDQGIFGVLRYKINESVVHIYRNVESHVIDSITVYYYNPLYGDMTDKYRYDGYENKNGITYPSKVRIEKYNGKVVDEVSISSASILKDTFQLLLTPIDYAFEVEEEEEEAISVTKYNDYLSFIDLKHTDDRVLVVEFNDYLLVAEAPISPANGELIIAEIKKSISDKPIKYFVFGHHHPHYLGGVRAFIHKETTVLCRQSNKSYVEYIANAKHSIQTDSLAIEPKKLRTQIIQDSIAVGEGQMVIYFIGEKSEHTNDYLIYYFPKSKLLFQDDLCWIPAEGEITKAGGRQQGLYQSVVDLGLDVETVVQSWPVASKKVKTIFSFDELKESITILDKTVE